MAVTSYSLLNDENEVHPSNLRMNLPRQFIKPVIPKGETTLSPEDECCVLSPEEGNIHQISPIDGPAAFLDILAPPYDHETGKRVCHYYQTIGMEKSKDRGDIMWLGQAGQPRDFWCDTAPYLGPEL
ncbi:hypothetical protein FSP39_003068 [Pinctada imbricata]|uniref:Uncharacterized protein n=1 Tax=Pinctada imbricata TaxID=66713 RepID=A0AA88Y586_PINIB|nr:hypothetical protein FSP39_003068 [Pinctada imbricata]